MNSIARHILNVLEEKKEPLSAVQIFNELSAKGVVRTTPPIYNALLHLVGEGKVKMIKEYQGRKLVRKWMLAENSSQLSLKV